MKENTNKIKKTAQGMTITFGLFSLFMLFVGVVSPLVDMFRRGEMLETLFFRYIGSIICALAVFAAFLIMILALHTIAKVGNPFSDKNIKTFKLSGNVMTYGGLFGSMFSVFSQNRLGDAATVEMYGLGFGLIICGIVVVMFLELLRYGSKVQDELDTIA
ncbi:MAG: DUF2975 domain-containing protein [Ruminococcus sp.]|nr:DUF2975 domain-containing protein [Ruminococcus sp.]